MAEVDPLTLANLVNDLREVEKLCVVLRNNPRPEYVQQLMSASRNLASNACRALDISETYERISDSANFASAAVSMYRNEQEEKKAQAEAEKKRRAEERKAKRRSNRIRKVVPHEG